MVTHSSILAGEISWTEETGGLQFMRFMEDPKKLLFTWILSVNIYSIVYMSIISVLKRKYKYSDMQKTLLYQKLKLRLFLKHKNTQASACQSYDIITGYVASGKLH